MTFDDYIKRIMEENEEILKNLGSDYDEEGVPYWEKWGSESKFDKEFDIDTTLPSTVD
jgi:hypothetical protein